MKRIIYYLILLINLDSTLSNAEVLAQSFSSITIKYTLQECIRMALEQSPDLAGPHQQVELAQLAVEQAKSQYKPRFGLNLSYGIDINDDLDVTTGDVSGGVFMNYDIFGGTYRRANLERAKANYQMALYQKKQSEINVTSSVIRGFYEILRNQHRLELADQTMENTRKNLRQLQILFDSGRAEILDLENAKLTVEESESGKTVVEHALAQSKSELNRILGLESKKEIELVPEPAQSIELKPLSEYQTYALENRMDLRIAEQNQKIAELTLKYAKLNKLPRLNLFTTGNIPINSSDNSSFVITPNLYWQIYDAGDAKFQIAYAQQNLYSTQTAYQVLKTKVALDIQKAYNALLESRQAEVIAQHRIKLAKENYRKGEIRYQTGQLSEFEFQRLQQELERVQIQVMGSNYDLAVAQANLQQAIGMELIVINVK